MELENIYEKQAQLLIQLSRIEAAYEKYKEYQKILLMNKWNEPRLLSACQDTITSLHDKLVQIQNEQKKSESMEILKNRGDLLGLRAMLITRADKYFFLEDYKKSSQDYQAAIAVSSQLKLKGQQFTTSSKTSESTIENTRSSQLGVARCYMKMNLFKEAKVWFEGVVKAWVKKDVGLGRAEAIYDLAFCMVRLDEVHTYSPHHNFF